MKKLFLLLAVFASLIACTYNEELIPETQSSEIDLLTRSGPELLEAEPSGNILKVKDYIHQIVGLPVYIYLNDGVMLDGQKDLVAGKPFFAPPL